MVINGPGSGQGRFSSCTYGVLLDKFFICNGNDFLTTGANTKNACSKRISESSKLFTLSCAIASVTFGTIVCTGKGIFVFLFRVVACSSSNSSSSSSSSGSDSSVTSNTVDLMFSQGMLLFLGLVAAIFLVFILVATVLSFFAASLVLERLFGSLVAFRFIVSVINVKHFA